MIDSGLVGSTDWEGYHKRRRCSRDTYHSHMSPSILFCEDVARTLSTSCPLRGSPRILSGGLVDLTLRVHFCHGRARVQERVFSQAYPLSADDAIWRHQELWPVVKISGFHRSSIFLAESGADGQFSWICAFRF